MADSKLAYLVIRNIVLGDKKTAKKQYHSLYSIFKLLRCSGISLELIVDIIENYLNLDEINNLLHDACIQNDIKEVKKLLKLNADVNIPRCKINCCYCEIEEIERYPLNIACESNNLNMVKLLIKRGADADSPDWIIHNNIHAIYYAYENNNIKMMKYLLKNGADINSLSLNSTLLQHACHHNNYKMAKYLLKNNIQYENFTTLVNYNSDLNIIKLLFEHNIDIHARELKFNTTPLRSLKLNFLNYILDNYYVKRIENKYIVINKSSINTDYVDKSYLALHISCLTNNIELLKSTLPNVNLSQYDNYRLLEYAYTKEALSLLLAHGININAKHEYTKDSILCDDNCNIDKSIFLIQNGANLNDEYILNRITCKLCECKTFDYDKSTIYAIFKNIEVSTYVVKPAHKNSLLLTDYAKACNNSKLLEILQSIQNNELFLACKQRNLQLISRLVKNNVNVTDENGNSLLHLVLLNNGDNGDYIKLLVTKGANANVYNKQKLTPLDMAYYNADLKSIKILLQHGAKFNYINFTKKLAIKMITSNDYELIKMIPEIKNINHPLLHLACIHNNYDMAKFLINDSNVNTKDHMNQTPLHLAILSNNINIVKLLLNAHADITIKDKFGCIAADYTCNQEILELLKGEECCVCLELTNVKTICNHYLCDECHSKLKTFTCPLCRKNLGK